MNELNQEQKKLAANQGITVMQVTGRTPCQIMLEHAEMLGYLKECARRDPGVENFVRKFIKDGDSERNWNKIIQPADFTVDTYHVPGQRSIERTGVHITHRPSGIVAYGSTEKTSHLNANLAWSEIKKRLIAAGWSEPA